jgi:hypothetical protein
MKPAGGATGLIRLSTELTNNNPSPLFFGYGIADQLSKKLTETLANEPADKVFLVTDETVHNAHGGLLSARRPSLYGASLH